MEWSGGCEAGQCEWQAVAAVRFQPAGVVQRLLSHCKLHKAVWFAMDSMCLAAGGAW